MTIGKKALGFFSHIGNTARAVEASQPWSAWSVSCSCTSNRFPQTENAGGSWGPTPQLVGHPAISCHSVVLVCPVGRWDPLRLAPVASWGDTVPGGSRAGHAGRLGAGDLCERGFCLGLVLVLATGLLPSCFNLFSAFRGLTGGMKWRFNLI